MLIIVRINKCWSVSLTRLYTQKFFQFRSFFNSLLHSRAENFHYKLFHELSDPDFPDGGSINLKGGAPIYCFDNSFLKTA